MKIKMISLCIILLSMLALTSYVQPVSASNWVVNSGNMLQCGANYDSNWAETEILGSTGAQVAYASYLLVMPALQKIDFRCWEISAWGCWQRLGAMPFTMMYVDYSLSIEGKTDIIRMEYIWKHWSGMYPKENFTVYTKSYWETDFTKRFTEVYEQPTYSAEARSYFPRHSMNVYWVRKLDNGYSYAGIQIFRDDLVGGGTWTSTRVGSYLFNGATFIQSIPAVMNIYVHSSRDIGSGDVTHSFMNIGLEEAVGDCIWDRKIDLKDTWAVGRAYGEVCPYPVFSEGYFTWPFFLMDTNLDAKIDLIDYYATSARYGGGWS